MITATSPSRHPTATLTAVTADDRPLVRAGLRAVLTATDGIELVAECPPAHVVETVRRELPSLLVSVVRGGDPDPFRAIAGAKALHAALRVLVVADAATVLDLREAVLVGVDSFVLTDATEDGLREAVAATARGDRIVSPQVAMQLAGPWRTTGDGTSALNARELEVLQLLAEGLTNQAVARRLELSPRTVKTHVQHVLAKLDVPDRTGAVARAFRLGLLR